MTDHRTARSRVCALALCATLIVLFVMSVTPAALLAEDQIDVKRDKDKTVYSIGQNGQIRQEEEQEREKAWEMLKHMGIIIDKRKNRPSQSQPSQSQPVPPTQSK